MKRMIAACLLMTLIACTATKKIQNCNCCHKQGITLCGYTYVPFDTIGKYKWYLMEDEFVWRDTPQPTYTIPKGDTMTIKPTGDVIILPADSTQPIIMSYKIDGKTIKKDTIGKKPRFDIPYYKEGWVPFPKTIEINWLPTEFYFDKTCSCIAGKNNRPFGNTYIASFSSQLK